MYSIFTLSLIALGLSLPLALVVQRGGHVLNLKIWDGRFKVTSTLLAFLLIGLLIFFLQTLYSLFSYTGLCTNWNNTGLVPCTRIESLYKDLFISALTTGAALGLAGFEIFAFEILAKRRATKIAPQTQP